MDQLLFTEVCLEMAYLDFLGSGSLASLLPPCCLHSVKSSVPSQKYPIPSAGKLLDQRTESFSISCWQKVRHSSYKVKYLIHVCHVNIC